MTDDTVREEVPERKLGRKNLAQRFRDSTLFLASEITVILVTIASLIFTAWEIRSSQNYREGTEIPLAERTLAEIEENSKFRKAEAIARAWSILTTKAPGNSGKVNALEYLASQGVPLIGIDLSCLAMGGIELQEDGEETCPRPVYLEKLDLSKWEEVLLENANLNYANLFKAKLSGADLRRADLSGAKLRRADLSGAKLRRADLIDANLTSADLIDANLRRADLSGADLSGANLTRANFGAVNLSGADFTRSTIDNYTDFSDAWAWRDQKPIGLDADIIFCVFDPEIHQRDIKTRPDTCARP